MSNAEFGTIDQLREKAGLPPETSAEREERQRKQAEQREREQAALEQAKLELAAKQQRESVDRGRAAVALQIALNAEGSDMSPFYRAAKTLSETFEQLKPNEISALNAKFQAVTEKFGVNVTPAEMDAVNALAGKLYRVVTADLGRVNAEVFRIDQSDVPTKPLPKPTKKKPSFFENFGRIFGIGKK